MDERELDAIAKPLVTMSQMSVHELLKVSCELYQRGRRDAVRELCARLEEALTTVEAPQLRAALLDIVTEAEGAS